MTPRPCGTCQSPGAPLSGPPAVRSRATLQAGRRGVVSDQPHTGLIRSVGEAVTATFSLLAVLCCLSRWSSGKYCASIWCSIYHSTTRLAKTSASRCDATVSSILTASATKWPSISGSQSCQPQSGVSCRRAAGQTGAAPGQPHPRAPRLEVTRQVR